MVGVMAAWGPMADLGTERNEAPDTAGKEVVLVENLVGHRAMLQHHPHEELEADREEEPDEPCE